VNAGLMALRNAFPLLMGASIGTTLSMQLISFRLTEYAFVAIALGFLCQALPRPLLKAVGRALLGFGLLFLGLDYLSGAIEPYRDELAPLLERIDGTTVGGMFLGILVAFVVTGVIQSSGATIGMLFALIGAGVFTDLRQVFPIVLGAHIGTAGTAILASLGANLEARRAAFSNLLFQVFNVGLAILLAPLIFRLAAAMGGDLVRQTANVHTLVMVLAVAVLLPVVPLAVRLIYKLTPSRAAVPQMSYLNPEFICKPEKAIYATLQELGRAVAVCRESFGLARGLFTEGELRSEQKIKLNEGIVNEVRAAVKNYLAALTRGYLSRRQAIMVQHLSHCMSDIERVGDHVERLMEIRKRQMKAKEGAFDEASLAGLNAVLEQADAVLAALADSLSPDTADFEKMAARLIAARDRYDEHSHEAKAAVNERVAAHQLHPLSGLFFSDYVSALDRIVKHCKMIAREQQQPYFRIKPRKIEKIVR
jgi:phosphate:Na+ symporter